MLCHAMYALPPRLHLLHSVKGDQTLRVCPMGSDEEFCVAFVAGKDLLRAARVLPEKQQCRLMCRPLQQSREALLHMEKVFSPQWEWYTSHVYTPFLLESEARLLVVYNAFLDTEKEIVYRCVLLESFYRKNNKLP